MCCGTIVLLSSSSLSLVLVLIATRRFRYSGAMMHGDNNDNNDIMGDGGMVRGVGVGVGVQKRRRQKRRNRRTEK